jgi:hypothetical protein
VSGYVWSGEIVFFTGIQTYFQQNQSVFESGDICSSAGGIPESLAEQPESRLTEKEISKLVQDEQDAPFPLGTRVYSFNITTLITGCLYSIF